ncbi:response regulator [Acanthopleuribacter pedis]|uniref:Response regulator n=1 Tax=Acanthopleuribacter pedis TaxID=442870 RepID=A0A8J7Q8U2_9BACT|nr:response regulator [Acanthopleuribacter pedis]MBO1319554.1 response regulator [Acanthopleuribacter pedis]
MTKKTILVVDDAPDNIQLLSAVLSRAYKVKAATHGEKALKIANKIPPPDMIVLDVVMPGMDGFQVCEALKQSETTRGIPVVFLSGTVTEVEREKAAALGAVAFLGKPIDRARLLATLTEVLG